MGGGWVLSFIFLFSRFCFVYRGGPQSMKTSASVITAGYGGTLPATKKRIFNFRIFVYDVFFNDHPRLRRSAYCLPLKLENGHEFTASPVAVSHATTANAASLPTRPRICYSNPKAANTNERAFHSNRVILSSNRISNSK